MKTPSELKEMVKDRYSQIAEQDMETNATSCCGATPTTSMAYNIMMDDYTAVSGYAQDANLGLGCGLPTQFARIAKGDVVVDLGSGAGNDCFIARHETGSRGKVIGLDFSPAMVAKSRKNAVKLGFNNVEFREADIEQMPLENEEANVVVSNCVLNLLPQKERIFKEIFRILKPGGHFSISDVVLIGALPEILQEDAEMYAGCVAGAIQKSDYLHYITEAGFENIEIQKEKPINIPIDILQKYLDETQIQNFQEGEIGIFSITVFAEKLPQNNRTEKLLMTQTQCTPGMGCC